jgi:hypothetical protein
LATPYSAVTKKNNSLFVRAYCLLVSSHALEPGRDKGP